LSNSKVTVSSNLRRIRRKRTPAAPVPQEVRLDPFQQKAIACLLDDYSVLVAAPTGTGKTLIAEKLLAQILALGRGTVYTSPLKALSNQKYRDFSRLFGQETVGLITGDLSINEAAPLLVMTTEIFRNWCFTNPEMLENTSHVIFDEMHYLDDRDRGTTWEESIIFAPPHIKILGLSATVPNVREIARWMEEIRNCKVKVIEEKKRAIPLKLRWISSSKEILNEEESREEIEERQEIRRLCHGWRDIKKNKNIEENKKVIPTSGRIVNGPKL
jgi:ATP-dependent RNA helicase HelY